MNTDLHHRQQQVPDGSPPLSDPNIAKSIHGRVFLITGGTQGLGLEVARTLQQLGAGGLVIISRNKDKGFQLEQELSSSSSSSPENTTSHRCVCKYVYADLSIAQDIDRAIRDSIESMKAIGPITGVVNAAATCARGNLLQTTASDFDLQMSLNVRAPLLITQGLAQHMIEQRPQLDAHCAKSIVNITSCAAHGGAPFVMAYSVSKAALVTLTKNNACELARYGIRVNAINMGWSVTDNEHATQVRVTGNENWIQEADQSCMLGRILRPRDIATTVAFLLSNASAMTTGSVIDLHPEYWHGILSTSVQETDGR